MGAFGQAAATQVRVIGALLLRDLVITAGRGSLPFLEIIIRPAAMILTFYIIGRTAGQYTPQGFPLLLFLITGFLTWEAFIRCFNQVSTEGAATLLYFPHVTALDVMLSRVAGAFVIRSAMFLLFCGIGMLFEKAPFPSDPLGVLVSYWCALAFALTLGMIAACVSRYTKILDDLWVMVRLTGHALSGVFFLGTAVPTPLLDIMRWNPLFQTLEWMRESWWGSYKSPIADPPYIFCVLFFMAAIGLAFERGSRRRRTL
jgi:capsular polysaccharide transport system permease protein